MRFAIALVLVAATAGAQQPAPRPTGHSLTGLPAVNFDADEGFGYGAALQYFDYGSGDALPYRFSLQPTVLITTRGRRDLLVFADAPHFLPGGWRFGGIAGQQRQLATPYYGIGNATVMDDNATTGPNPYFYRYGRSIILASGDFQHSLGFPALRILLGGGVRRVTATPVPYDSGTTLFAQQFGSTQLPSRDTRYLRAGIVVDTRDREIGTHSGTWSEILVQSAGGSFGGDESYTRITGNIRNFVPLGDDVTLAERVVLQTVRGSPSVSELSFVQSSFRDDEALGGATSVRGLPRNRYAGKGVAFGNAELRWSAARFHVLDRDTHLILSGFVDAGRVWADGLDVSQIVSDLHVGYGGGVHFAVGPSFVVSADVGHSSQSAAAVYIGLGYLF
jgi:hypothetical protein